MSITTALWRELVNAQQMVQPFGFEPLAGMMSSGDGYLRLQPSSLRFQNALSRIWKKKVEPRKMPFWLPGPDSATPDVKKVWDEIVGAGASSDRWSLVEAHDLNEESVEHPVTPADVSQLVAAVRAGVVLEVRAAASLTDGVLQQIRSQAG